MVSPEVFWFPYENSVRPRKPRMTVHSSPLRLPILSSPATEGSLVQRLIGSRGRRALKPRGHQILVRGPCGSGAGLPDPTGGRATAFWRPDKAAPPAGSRLRVRGGRNLVRSVFLQRSAVQLWVARPDGRTISHRCAFPGAEGVRSLIDHQPLARLSRLPPTN